MAPTPAHGGEAGGKANPLELQPSLAIWTLVVFVGLFFVLGRFAWKPLLQALHQREEHLEHVLHETERARNESEQLLAEHRRQMAQAADEVRAHAREGPARTPRRRPTRSSSRPRREAEAARAARPARDRHGPRPGPGRDLEKTADMAVSVAGRVLSKELSDDDHRRLLDARDQGAARRAGRANGHGGRRPRMTDSAAAPRANAEQSVVDDDQSELARRYADALVERGRRSEGQADAVLDELAAIERDVLKADPAVRRRSWPRPRSRRPRRTGSCVEVFGERASSLVLRFLRVLNRHDRLGLLAAVAREARPIWDRRHKRIPVQVRSAVPLDEGQVQALRDRLAGMIAATPDPARVDRPGADRRPGRPGRRPPLRRLGARTVSNSFAND